MRMPYIPKSHVLAMQVIMSFLDNFFTILDNFYYFMIMQVHDNIVKDLLCLFSMATYIYDVNNVFLIKCFINFTD